MEYKCTHCSGVPACLINNVWLLLPLIPFNKHNKQQRLSATRTSYQDIINRGSKVMLHALGLSQSGVYSSNMHSSAVEMSPASLIYPLKCLQSALKGCVELDLKASWHDAGGEPFHSTCWNLADKATHWTHNVLNWLFENSNSISFQLMHLTTLTRKSSKLQW